MIPRVMHRVGSASIPEFTVNTMIRLALSDFRQELESFKCAQVAITKAERLVLL